MLVHMEEDVIRASLTPKHSALFCVVSHHPCLASVCRLEYFFQTSLVWLGICWLPPGVRLQPFYGTRSSLLRTWTALSLIPSFIPVSAPASLPIPVFAFSWAWSPWCSTTPRTVTWSAPPSWTPTSVSMECNFLSSWTRTFGCPNFVILGYQA